MKALILNSGLGFRMGVFTKEHPKCMTDISDTETILSRQLKLLVDAGIKEVVMTTGYFDEILMEYSKSLNFPLEYTFVKNPIYDQTNYIYSIYCAREHLKNQDIILMKMMRRKKAEATRMKTKLHRYIKVKPWHSLKLK